MTRKVFAVSSTLDTQNIIHSCSGSWGGEKTLEVILTISHTQAKLGTQQ